MTANTNKPTFEDRIQAHWTPERLKKLTSGHKYAVLPTAAPGLLRVLGLLNDDGSMSADASRKFIQINHLFSQFKTALEDLNERHKVVRILDAGCGSSFLTFLLGWAYNTLWQKDVQLIGIDSNGKLIAKNQKNAETLGLASKMNFLASSIADFDWWRVVGEGQEKNPENIKTLRPHAVISLHACDTATDDALALGIKLKSDFIAVSPCCQAELAKHWKVLGDQNNPHALLPAFRNPHLRREIAAHMTDLLRVLLLRANGYEVTTTEFTMSHATPKNTLIMAIRRGTYHEPSLKEYEELKATLGGFDISLAHKIRD